MVSRRSVKCILLVGLSTSFLHAQFVGPTPQLPDVHVGQSVLVQLEQIPTEPVSFSISKDGVDEHGLIVTPTLDPPKKTAAFVIDRKLVPGRYLVTFIAGKQRQQLPGELRIHAPDTDPVRLDDIFPAVVYPDTDDAVDIIGVNLSSVPSDNVIDIQNGAPVLFATAAECEKPQNDVTKLCVKRVEGFDTRRIRLTGVGALKNGPALISVRVGEGAWSNKIQLTRVPYPLSTIRLSATILTALMALLIYFLARLAARTQQSSVESFGPVSVLLLDKETDTWSLSKFQLLVWTAVFVLTYFYLALCRLFVQWSFAWPPVPTNMPELLGLSAGAGVVAAGISSLKGSKGAGGIRPTVADFVTTGGIVAGERLQFFIWTIVGALVFVLMVFRSDPVKFQQLPEIPGGFLYLMGVSSLAYLGGKVARKAGPVIKSVSVDTITKQANGEVVVNASIQGDNLHQNATYLLDKEKLRTVKVVKQVPVAPNDGFCTELVLSMTTSDAVTVGQHELTLANPDGQSADADFPVNPLTVDPGLSVAMGGAPVVLNVLGKNFVGTLTSEWVDSTGTVSTPLVTRVSDTQITVSIIPGTQKGTGTLTLISSVAAGGGAPADRRALAAWAGLGAILKSYGKAGETGTANGSTVVVDFTKKGEGGVAQRTSKDTITVNFNPGFAEQSARNPAPLDGLVAHEGQHVADGAPSGKGRLSSEINAERASQAVYEGLSAQSLEGMLPDDIVIEGKTVLWQPDWANPEFRFFADLAATALGLEAYANDLAKDKH